MREITQTMEKMFKAENPIWLTIVIGIFVLALALIPSPSSGAKLLDLIFYKKRQKQKKELTDKFFLNHPVFDFLAYNLERLKTLDFGSEGKTALARDMLFIFFTTYKERIKEFITESINLEDRYALKKLAREKILTADSAVTSQWLGLKVGGIENTAKEFNTWQAQSKQFAQMAIYNITDSDIYDSPQERLQEILITLEARFRATLPDIEKGLAKTGNSYDNLKNVPVYVGTGRHGN
jgi:hypothetical protein